MRADGPCRKGECRECAAAFAAQRATREFCSDACRRAFHNRLMTRGSDMYSLFMACRYDRRAAKAERAWSLLSRMAAAWRAEDARERAGRQSWDPVAKVRERNGQLGATVVGLNVDGRKR